MTLTRFLLAVCVAVVCVGSCKAWYRPPSELPMPVVLSPTPDPSAAPASIDWRTVAPLSSSTIQFIPRWCGSCWAFAVTSSLTDRLRISYGKTHPTLQYIHLSPQVLLNCGTEHGVGSCDGGSWELSNAFIHTYGITDLTSMPYEGVDRSFVAELPCDDMMARYCDLVGNCFPVPNPQKYYVSEFGYVNGTTAMEAEIATRGPISCSMFAHVDAFMHYTGGVIDDKTPFAPGNTTHVISLVGYGATSDGTPYWIGRNSFGSAWGEDGGWFRIVRGFNSLNIESHCGWAVPAEPSTNATHTVPLTYSTPRWARRE